MQHRRLGHSSLIVSAVGIGTMSWPHCYYGETPPAGAEEGVDRAAIRDLVSAALDAGVTLFDTAEGYGRGFAETLLGRALEELGQRDAVKLISKVGPLFAEEQQGRGGRACDLTPAHIRARCEGSLRRLRTDRIDLYLAHHPDPFTPVGETVGAFKELQQEGKIAAFGVSNFDQALLAEALAHGPVAADELPYSLVQRGIDAGVRPYCAREHVSILAHSPLGKGVLSGRYDAAHLPPPDDYRHQRPHFAPGNLSRNLALAQRCRDFAGELSATPAQVALAWSLAQPGIAVVLPGGRTVEQIRESAGAGSVLLPEAVLAELDHLSQ